MLWFVAVPAGLFLAACLGLYLFQGKLVFAPRTGFDAEPGDAGLAFEELWLDADPGRVHAWFVPGRDGVALSGRCALFCHGNGGNISHRLETLALFHSLGLGTLIFDYPGYGRSPGKPTEHGCHAAARAGWDHLLARSVDPAGIVVWGRSLGGAVASCLARDVRPAALIIESCFTSIPAMGAHQYPFIPRFLLKRLCRIRFNALADVAQAPCSVLVAHSPGDEIVPFAMANELFSAAPEPKTFVELTGGHNEGWQLAGTAYIDAVRDFLLGLAAQPNDSGG